MGRLTRRSLQDTLPPVHLRQSERAPPTPARGRHWMEDPDCHCKMEDPGIVLCYAADELVHDAVGEPGSPVTRGPTPAVSASRLRDYIFRTILSTLLSEDENCVVQKASGAGTSFFHTVFHRVSQDQYYRVVQKLRRVFITDQTPTADWSRLVARDSAPPLVTLLQVVGGSGVGQVQMSTQSFGDGIFKY